MIASIRAGESSGPCDPISNSPAQVLRPPRRSRPRLGSGAYHEQVSQPRGASRSGRMPATAAERILSAAMREFAKYGFAGARVERIVSRADVSPRSLYYHFDSKRGLYDAVRERLSSQHFEDFVRGVTDEPLVD